MPAGRPAKYPTPADLQKAVDEYFQYCEEKEKIPNVIGITWFLGFADRNEFKCQADRGEEFSRIVKVTLGQIYDDKLQLAASGKMNPTIFIFDAINNHGMINTRSENKNDNKHGGADGGPLKYDIEVVHTTK